MSGLLWFSLLIPFILAGVLMAIPSLRRKTLWWELAIPVVATVITVFICQFVAVRSATNDKEYWGNMSYTVTHEEPMTYQGECSEQYACGTYSCGTTKSPATCTTYCTRYYDCDKTTSRTCYLTDDRGGTLRVSYAKYKEIDKRWKHNEYKVGKMTKKDAHHTTTGDKYKKAGRGNRHIVKWDQIALSSEPIVTEHTYENRLQTQSHWGEVSDKDKIAFDVFEYPSVPGGWRLKALLSNGPAYRKADTHLQYLNGHLNTTDGGYKKIRLWVLVYSGKTQEAAELQRAHWKGGNKNELTIMIGTNEAREITWADTMAHTDDSISETLKINIRDKLLVEMEKTSLNDASMLEFVTWLGPNIQEKFTKPSFKQYAYIQVQPSLFAIILSYIIVLIVNLGAGAFVVYNPWQEGGSRSKRRRGGYRYR
jgi:hypothetical protein